MSDIPVETFKSRTEALLHSKTRRKKKKRDLAPIQDQANATGNFTIFLFDFTNFFQFHVIFQTHPDLPGRTSQDVSKTQIRVLQPRFYHQTQG